MSRYSDPSPNPTSVLITGASSGIGKACALWLDRRGLLVFAGVRRQEYAEALSAEGSGRLIPIRLDVTELDLIAAARDEVAATVGEAGLYGLVNNAGIATGGPLEFIDLADLQHTMAVNLTGALAVTQAFLPLLRPARGRIINMSSISGRVALPFVGPYAISKHGLEAMRDSLRVELRPWGIWVAVIAPGNVVSPIWDKAGRLIDDLMARATPEQLDLYGQVSGLRDLLGRNAMPPEKVARAVEHALLSRRPKARYLLGREARIMAFLLRRLPVRLRDWLIAANMPKYG